MTSKTRTERRFIARYSIRFGRKDLNKVGFSIDLSSTGVGIASKKGYKVDSIIRIELKTPNENFLLTGQVRWVKVGTLPGANEMGYEMGISLRDRPRSYLKLLDELIDKQVIKTEPEFNGIPFSVSYETNAFFHSEYLSNIAHDGLFVPCSEPLPELQSKTRVGLKLLESMAMYMVEGLVIYHRAPNECGDGEEPGFAIQIQDYLTAPKSELAQLGAG